MKKITWAALGLFLVISLAGCKVQQHIQETRTQYETPPFEMPVPEFEVVSEDEVPGDVRLVTAAILEKMRHEKQSLETVRFARDGKHVLSEPDFAFEGFNLDSVIIEEYQAQELSDEDYLCRLKGYLTFVDPLNRQTVNYYTAEYRMTSAGITIDKSAAFTVSPVFPETKAFILKEEHLEMAVRSAESFIELYAEVAAMAQSMTPTREEIRQKREQEEMSFFERLRSGTSTESKDQVMVIFVMNRLTPDAALEVVVSDTLHGRSSAVSPSFLDFNGWQVAAFGGDFAIDHDVFYTKVYYRPAPGVLPEGEEEVLVGLFTNEKNYEDPDVVQKTAHPEPETRVKPQTEGPLAAGRVMLSTSSNDEAEVIQTRLAELGFYNMAIDGLWGPGSRKALQNYQESAGLDPHGEWNMQTQMKLFSGTGR